MNTITLSVLIRARDALFTAKELAFESSSQDEFKQILGAWSEMKATVDELTKAKQVEVTA